MDIDARLASASAGGVGAADDAVEAAHVAGSVEVAEGRADVAPSRRREEAGF